MKSLLNIVEAIRHSNTVAAGVTTITPGSGIDMQDYEGCMFVIEWGAILTGGVQSAEVHQSSDDGSADAYTALIGSKVTVADSDDSKVTVIDIKNPRERYLKCIVNRGSFNSTIEGITALLYGPRKMPVTQGTTVQGSEAHTEPAEGAA